uniref:Zinc finger protein-like 1 n=1 Tax=Sphenodon punctatus TaxID=8508 RepID=A0A8D0L302_SPHPU
MGLCKCPKRKVTNLFCFEHRVNVCESCLVANHAKVTDLGSCTAWQMGGSRIRNLAPPGHRSGLTVGWGGNWGWLGIRFGAFRLLGCCF